MACDGGGQGTLHLPTLVPHLLHPPSMPKHEDSLTVSLAINEGSPVLVPIFVDKTSLKIFLLVVLPHAQVLLAAVQCGVIEDPIAFPASCRPLAHVDRPIAPQHDPVAFPPPRFPFSFVTYTPRTIFPAKQLLSLALALPVLPFTLIAQFYS